MPSFSRHLAAHVVFLAAAFLGVAACGRSGPEKSDPEIFTWSGALKAPASVNLRNINGTIDVKPSADDSVRVSAAARWHRGNPKTDLKFDVVNAEGSITICVLWTKGTCSSSEYTTQQNFLSKFLKQRGTDARVTLTVFVPARVKVDVLTMNGDLHVAATAPVKAHTLNGAIQVATAVGPVEAESMNGSVDVRMTTLGEDGPVRAITINGSVSAYLPEQLNAAVSLAAVNGRVGSDFPISMEGVSNASRHLDGMVGAGGREVKVSTVNGSAWLHRLSADGTPIEGPASTKP